MAKILVVDDEAYIARVLSMWLVRHGHQVLEADNGATALEVLDREPVDMIISDLNMPVLDGIGLVKAVRDERGLLIPCMVVTARCDRAELAETMRTYNIELYPKPFVPSRLVADIERILGATAS